jgi:hypothetical protein
MLVFRSAAGFIVVKKTADDPCPPHIATRFEQNVGGLRVLRLGIASA